MLPVLGRAYVLHISIYSTPEPSIVVAMIQHTYSLEHYGIVYGQSVLRVYLRNYVYD